MIKTRHESRRFQREFISLEYLLSYHIYESPITLHIPGFRESTVKPLVNYGYLNKKDVEASLCDKVGFRANVVDALLSVMNDDSRDLMNPYEREEVVSKLFDRQGRDLDNYLFLLEESILSEFKTGLTIDVERLRSSPAKLVAVSDMLAGKTSQDDMQRIMGSGDDTLVIHLESDYGKLLLRLSLQTPEGYVYTPTLIEAERRSEVMDIIREMCRELDLSAERTQCVCDQGEWLTESAALPYQTHLVRRAPGHCP